MAKLKVRAGLVELYTRIIKPIATGDKIYKNGEDNLYPYTIDRAINNSPTATRASYIMSKYIAGQGVAKDIEVNKKKAYYLSDAVNIISEDVTDHKGCFIWIGYGINEAGDITENKLDILDYSNCRISKEDDNDYPGKIYVKDYSSESKVFKSRSNSDDKKWYYPYNPNKEVIKAQMRADVKAKRDKRDQRDITIEDMVRDYRGQVFYLNLTPKYKYALSTFDSVFNDMDSEYRFSLYTNTQFREGFLGKVAVLTQGLDEEDKKTVKKDTAKWLGSENSGGLYHLSVEHADDIEQIMKVIQLEPQFDDKLFIENDKRIRRNILGAANNLPEPLIYAGEGALFGTSADAYTEMKRFYQEQTQRERRIIEKTLTRLGFPTQIIPILEEKPEPTKEENNGDNN